MRSWMAGSLLAVCLCVTTVAQLPRARPTPPADAKTEAEKAELKSKTLDLLGRTARQLHDMRATENRVAWQLQLAVLLWPHDAAQARPVWDEAAAGWKEVVSRTANTEGVNNQFHNLYLLRSNLARTLSRYDGPAALQFVRSTREFVEPFRLENFGPEAEIVLETEIAAELARTDPQAALKIAQESLPQGATNSHINVLNQLRANDRAAAQTFGRQIYERLRETDFLQSGAGYAGLSLAQLAHSDLRANQPGPTPLLTQAELRGLMERLINAALSFTPDRVMPGYYSPEYSAARDLLNTLGSWPEVEQYAPGRRAEMQARTAALNQAASSPQGPQRDYNAINTLIQQRPLAEALDRIAAAPPQIRESLYQQAAWKAAQSGDLEQARSIINAHVRNPNSRAYALRQAEQQAFYYLVGKNQINEARALLARTPAGHEQAAMLMFLADRFAQQDKKTEALQLLDEARNQLPPRPADQNQLPTHFRLLQIYQRLDSARAFSLLEPWVEQFNEMAAAAEKLDGFAGDFYRDGEFLPSGHPLAAYSSQFAQSFGMLAQSDFDRTQAQIAKFQRPEAQVLMALAIGRQILENRSQRTGGINSRPSLPPPRPRG